MLDSLDDQIWKTKAYNMEKECFQQIKNSEKNIEEEFKVFREGEEEIINEYKASSNIKDALEKVLEKSLQDKAREKFNKDLLKDTQNASADAVKDDILAAYLDAEDRAVLSKKLDAQKAKDLKNKIMHKFKTRVFARADIIEKRIKKERQEVGL